MTLGEQVKWTKERIFDKIIGNKNNKNIGTERNRIFLSYKNLYHKRILGIIVDFIGHF